MGNRLSSTKRANRKKRKPSIRSLDELFGAKSRTSNPSNESPSIKSLEELFDTKSRISDTSNESSSSYFLKDGKEEFDRLQRVHFFNKYFFDDKNISAPCTEILERGCSVLDIGCGPGAWVLDCATEFPKSHFIGVDISPIFPQAIKPCNTSFVQADVLDGLPFEPNSFDIVHLGNMAVCFTEQEWKLNVIPEIIRVTKPGGWFEILDFRFKMLDIGPCMKKLLDVAIEYLKELGINPDFIIQMKDWLIDDVETITDVQELSSARSVGDGGILGATYVDNSLPAIRHLSPQYCRILNITKDELDKIINGFLEEFKVYKQTVFYHKVFARKL